MKFRLKTGDMVKIIAGKDKGKTGKVKQTFSELNRVVVEGANMTKRHLKSKKRGEKGQIVDFSMPMHASNVQVLGEDGKTRKHKQREKVVKTKAAKQDKK